MKSYRYPKRPERSFAIDVTDDRRGKGAAARNRKFVLAKLAERLKWKLARRAAQKKAKQD